MTRNVNRKRSHHRTSPTLRLETLESRRLLAVAAFESELLVDNNGVPGEVIVDNTVTAGETFFLRVTTQEFDPMRYGLQSVGVDIEWDASLLDVVEEDFVLESVITANLPVLQKGTLDQASGTIEGLSGTSLSALGAGRPIGNAVPETFVLIRMRAGDEAGVAELDLQKGSAKTITAPTASLGERHLDFDSETITIVAPASESETPIESTPNPIPSEPDAEESPDAPVEEPAASVEEPVAAEPEEILPQETLSVEPEETIEPETGGQEIDTPVVELPVETPVEEVAPSDPSDDVLDASLPAEEAFEEPSEVTSENTEPTESNQEQADAVDEVMSFDFNGDGIFDLADFGLMNAQASSDANATSVEVESAVEHAEPMVSDEHKTAEPEVELLAPCIAIPAIGDVAATEQWLDEFAKAWLADSDARAQRREESLLF
ncbi:hypothetical protein [Rhodopirellula sallentina]|uniref:Uncharacterized protein n=1 Tax=Rhodopirellula sallentina SM41 TaxID=1263870 RepID=M5U2Q8_9BACT|nr:hypothetical protein [Rhodopirellula sallentina]EMI55569.1 hypothetical protein RSSM_02976 [Rhodopirellula sallentina SM41]